MDFGKNLKARRTELGMSQVQLAELVGVTHPMIVKLENGVKTPNILLAEAIAKALYTTVQALID